MVVGGAPLTQFANTLGMFTGRVVIDRTGNLVLANERARAAFGLVASDLGRPLQDLELSYRPVELRSLIDEVRMEHDTVVHRDVRWQKGNDAPRTLAVQVDALSRPGDLDSGIIVSYIDATEHRARRSAVISCAYSGVAISAAAIAIILLFIFLLLGFGFCRIGSAPLQAAGQRGPR